MNPLTVIKLFMSLPIIPARNTEAKNICPKSLLISPKASTLMFKLFMPHYNTLLPKLQDSGSMVQLPPKSNFSYPFDCTFSNWPSLI